MPRTLTSTTQRLFSVLPPYYENSYDAQGVLQTLANEIDLLDAKIAMLVGVEDGTRGEFFPLHSEELLGEWEKVLGLGSDPTKTTAQRRTIIRAVLRTMKSTNGAEGWRSTFTDLIGTGWMFTTDYASSTITLYLPFGTPMSAPTGFTVSASGTGNTLAAGTYYYAVTAVNGYGESEYAGGTSVAISSGQRANLSWTAPATGTPTQYYVYRGTSVSTMRRLTTTTAITTTSYNDTGAATLGDFLAPTSSTTQSDSAATAYRIARAITPAHINIALGYTTGFIVSVSKVGDTL